MNSNVLWLKSYLIGSVTITQGNSWLNLISLLLFIELGKILLGIYVICVIDCNIIKSAIVHTTCIIGSKVFCIFACVCYCVHFEYIFIIAAL